MTEVHEHDHIELTYANGRADHTYEGVVTRKFDGGLRVDLDTDRVGDPDTVEIRGLAVRNADADCQSTLGALKDIRVLERAKKAMTDGGRTRLDADVEDAISSAQRERERQTELLEEIRDTQERQADALEALAGGVLLLYDIDENSGRNSIEALYEEARAHGTGRGY